MADEVQDITVIQSYDIDEDGYIDRKEMLEIVKAILKMSRHNSLSNKLSVSEDIATPEERVDDIIKQLDINMDGKLSEKEFRMEYTGSFEMKYYIGILDNRL